MANYFKFNTFVEGLAEGVFNLGTNQLKMFLVNANDTCAATDDVIGDLNEVQAANGNGYTVGGVALGNITSAQTSGVYKLSTPDNPSWTCTGNTVGPFMWVALYASNSTPANRLIGAWNYGSNVTLAVNESFTADLDATNGILTIE